MSLLDRLDDASRERLVERDPPQFVEPMLATLSDEPFSHPSWIFERKLDGVRTLAFRHGDAVRVRSRRRNDLSASFPEIVDALRGPQPAGDDFVLDGEVVALEGNRTNFSLLQARTNLSDPATARRSGVRIAYYVFDMLRLDGHDLTLLSLRTRKSLLRGALGWSDPIRYTPHRNGDGEMFLLDACTRGWEGLIAKRADAPYRHRRSLEWRKLKCVKRQELVIGGYTAPGGTRYGFGALLVGYYEGDDLVYAGKVGTGFDTQTLRDLSGRLRSREQDTSPFGRGEPPREDVRWVRPELVCEVGFAEWTNAGRLRHSRYLGLRNDKTASEVVREAPPT